MTSLDDRRTTTSPGDDVVLAAELVIASQVASVQMLNRKLRIGWDDATALMGELERAGVVGEELPGGMRPVLVAPDGMDEVVARFRDRPVDPPPPAVPPAGDHPGVEMVKRAPAFVAELPPAEIEISPAVDDEVPASPATGRPRQTIIGRPVWRITTLATSPPATRAIVVGRTVFLPAWVAAQGGKSWVDRVHSAATFGKFRNQARAANAAGDVTAEREIAALLNDLRDARIKRIHLWLDVVARVARATVVAATVALGLLVVGGVVAVVYAGAPGWVAWWASLGAVVATGWAIWLWAWWAISWFGLPFLAVLLYREGKRHASPPLWLLAPDKRALVDSEITPSRVILALREAGISALRKALANAEDAGAGMLGPISIAGCGVEVDVLLPYGVPTSKVLAAREPIAENMGRKEHELFMTLPETARTVRMWIARPGALDEPVGPSPMVIDPTFKADYYTGHAPWGNSLRGDPIGISVKQRHLALAGISNQGKTTTGRALALWLAYDVTVEFQIGDLKGIGDWHMFTGLATVLIEGPTDDHVVAVTEMLESGVREMERRQAALDKDRYPDGVTRELARQPGSGFHPIVYIVDEQQVAIMCPAVGPDKRPYGGTKKNSRYFNAVRYLLNQGRAYNLTVWQKTQNPTDANFPVLLREGAHVRASLPVGTESQARMACGENAVEKGAAPHELRAGLDKGVVVVAGDGAPLEVGQHSITIRTHFIDGVEATRLAKAAIERRRKAGRLLAQAESGQVVAVDHLADINVAMQEERRVRTVVVLGRLIEDNPAVYEEWGHGDLAAAVDEYEHLGLGIRKYGGDSVLRLEEVQHALGMRQ